MEPAPRAGSWTLRRAEVRREAATLCPSAPPGGEGLAGEAAPGRGAASSRKAAGTRGLAAPRARRTATGPELSPLCAEPTGLPPPLMALPASPSPLGDPRDPRARPSLLRPAGSPRPACAARRPRGPSRSPGRALAPPKPITGRAGGRAAGVVVFRPTPTPPPRLLGHPAQSAELGRALRAGPARLTLFLPGFSLPWDPVNWTLGTMKTP